LAVWPLTGKHRRNSNLWGTSEYSNWGNNCYCVLLQILGKFLIHKLRN